MLDRSHTLAEAHADGADTSNDAALARRHAFLACFAWLAFIVYGSLLPFELRGYSIEQAIDVFQEIPYRSLGVTSRADWVANILLYVPLGYLGCAWIAGSTRQRLVRALAVSAVFVACATVAVAIEFTQIFFAPRTVSLNDLLAETLGAAGGITVWSIWSRRLHGLARAFARGGRASLMAAMTLYLLVYVAMSLFPFDFLVSVEEFANKLASDNLAWLVAGQCRSWVRCVAPRAGELLAIAPLGVLLALTARQRLSLPRLFLAGAAFGAVLELMQIAIASGSTQGLSVLLRGVGLVAGASLGHTLRLLGPQPIARAGWRTAMFAALPYLVAIAAVNGWFNEPWISTEAALARLGDVRLMPFYYHYFSTEVAAMASLLAQVAMYGPIGFAVWAHHAISGSAAPRRWPAAALAATAIALPIEFGKLWGPPRAHPDFTNALIAAATAALAYALARWLEAILHGARYDATADADRSPAAHWPNAAALPPIRAMAASIAAGLTLLAGLVSYPVGTLALAAGLLLCAVCLHQRPAAWLLLIPAALALLDLSPITGSILLDEFDLLVLLTLAIGYWRTGADAPRPYPSRLFPLALTLLWVTWAVASARGLWPLLEEPGLVLPPSSHSPLDAWSVGKGLLWALLLVPLLRRIPETRLADARRLLLRGLAGALVLLALVVAWQRHLFVGLFDFDHVLRVTGTFASMRTGGAYIEAFIAFALPALLGWTILQRTWFARLAGIAGTAAASYTMLVTFSRAGYAAVLVGVVVMMIGMLHLRAETGRRGIIALAGLLAVTGVVALPVLSGGFAQARLAAAGDDLAARLAHWQRALALMDDDIVTPVAGMGFGRYPSAYLLTGHWQRAPGTFSIRREDTNHYLRLGAGEPVYLEQSVAIERGAGYILRARIRGADTAPALRIAICEKTLLYSFACDWHELGTSTAAEGWTEVSSEVEAASVGQRGSWPRRPTRLSLLSAAAGHVIDLDDVRLQRSDGRELIANGDFESGATRWLLVADQAQAWHIDQQLVETYFAQGLLGLMALAVLLIASGRAVCRAMRHGSVYAISITAAVASFLTVGLLGSVVDTARLSMLLYLGLLAGALLLPARRSR